MPISEKLQRHQSESRGHGLFKDASREVPVLTAKDGTTRRMGQNPFSRSLEVAAKQCGCELETGVRGINYDGTRAELTPRKDGEAGQGVALFPAGQYVDVKEPAAIRDMHKFRVDVEESNRYLRESSRHSQPSDSEIRWRQGRN